MAILKRFPTRVCMGVALALTLFGGGANAQSLRIEALTCEYLKNPIGIETTAPRLSWKLASKTRGAAQSAYQILAATSPEALKRNRGDLWDSGERKSDRSIQIEYAGKPLRSRQRVYWKARVRDEKGRDCGWSAPQYFELGLLEPADWKAKWIGANLKGAANVSLEGARWIWFPEGNPQNSAPAATRFFRYRLRLKEKRVRSATLYIAADNDHAAWVNGTSVGTGSAWQSFAAHAFQTQAKAGDNVIAVSVKNADGPAGLLAVGRVEYEDGTSENFRTGKDWKTAAESERGWRTLAFSDANWKPALDFAEVGAAPWGKPGLVTATPPATYLNRRFEVAQKVKSARVYATAKGLYHLFLNGKRVGEDILTPGWTDYRKRIQYQTYDVTKEVVQGANVIAMSLGDGWYAGHIAWAGRQNYGPVTRGLAQLEIEFEDGSRTVIATDSAWKSGEGAIRSADILMGEEYDARKEVNHWNAPEGDVSQWSEAIAEPLGSTPLVASTGSTVRKITEIKPIAITEKPAGAYIFDLGQNMVGWARLKVQGAAGTQIRLRFAEMLNPDGSIYVTNLRAARCTDLYTLKGGAPETYEPSFTFHGFRYVEVTGLANKPTKEAITGVVISSAADMNGTFDCSNPMVKKLQHNIVWGMRGNYLEAPTDCPQRDERLGWMGDSQVFIRTACFNANIAPFMTKWVQDVRDAQSPAGAFSDVSPRVAASGDGAPAWGDAGVIVPWTVYLFYDDRRLLAKHFESMKRWVDFVHEGNPNLLWRNRAGANYGDWLNHNADMPRDVLGTAYFAYSAKLTAQAARALGKTEDAEKYERLFEGIRTAFQKAFLQPNGRIQGDTQTCYLVALHFDLLPDSVRAIAGRHLADDVVNRRGGHLSTGFVGVGYLNPTLTRMGYSDIAYRLLLNDTYPSWGYSIRHGATTIWERWDGWTAEKGFQDPGMNSFNHYSLGSVGEWLYASVAGIEVDPKNPGFKHILMRPQIGGGLTYARATHESPYGTIASHWRLENGRILWTVTVPPNTTATITVPTQGETLENGAPASQAKGLQFRGISPQGATFEAQSGTYQFSAPL